VIQHNCAKGGQMVEAALDTAVHLGADLVLFQEPREAGKKDSTRSHDSFRWIKGEEGLAPKCWVAVSKTSKWQVTEVKDLARRCDNYVQVLEVTRPGQRRMIVVNVYDQVRTSDRTRPAQNALWEVIMHRETRTIVAGDMNAHSRMWNARVSNTVNRSNATFWEGLIENNDLTIWNTEDATRLGKGATNHSTIDLTLPTRNLELNWAIAGEEEATGSDHEMIVWEVLGCGTSNSGTSNKTTGWDIGSWDPRNKDEEGMEKAEKKKRAARETFIKLIGALGPLDDESTVEQADEAAAALRTA